MIWVGITAITLESVTLHIPPEVPLVAVTATFVLIFSDRNALIISWCLSLLSHLIETLFLLFTMTIMYISAQVQLVSYMSSIEWH